SRQQGSRKSSDRPPAGRSQRSNRPPVAACPGFLTTLRTRYLPPSICTAILVALVIATIPRLPIADDLESSWSSVLTYAHQKGLQLGTDIVFTYGPLGFLTIPCFSGSFIALRMLVDIALALAVSVPLCLLTWRLSRAWRFLVLGVFLVVTSN